MIYANCMTHLINRTRLGETKLYIKKGHCSTNPNFQKYLNFGEITSQLYFRSLLLQNKKKNMSQLP
jgi:hypothetical protein